MKDEDPLSSLSSEKSPGILIFLFAILLIGSIAYELFYETHQ
jgi:hypothetical protein